MAILRRLRNGEQASGRPYRFLALEALEDRLSPSANPFQPLSSPPGSLISNSLNKELTTLQGQLGGVLDQGNGIPFIGNVLGTLGAGNVINAFQQKLDNGLQISSNSFPSDSAIRSALSGALGSMLGNISNISPPPNASIVDNIYIAHPSVLGGTQGIVIEMLLHGQTAASTPDFATGLPSLPIQVTAKVMVSASFTYELGFQYNANNGTTSFAAPPNLQPFTASPLTVTVSANPSFTGGANFGFVHGSVATMGLPTANSLNVTFAMNNLDDPTSATLTGSANMHLHLTGGLGPTAEFPSIGANFHLSWVFNAGAAAPTVGFDGVSLDLGGFLGGILDPILTEIQKVTAPILPVLKILNTPLPGISDISEFLGQGPVTLLSLAGQFAGAADYGPLFQVVSTVANLVQEFDSFDVQDMSIPLGGFNLGQDLRNLPMAGNDLDPSDGNLSPDLALPTDTPDYATLFKSLPSGARMLLGALAAGPANGASFNFSFPILDDPAAAVFAMLLGKDSDLVSLTADVNINSDQNPGGLSFGGVGFTFDAHAHIIGHIKIGYDTYGIREAVHDLATNPNANILSDVLDGIYVAAGPGNLNDPTNPDPSKNGSFFNITGGIDAGIGFHYGLFGLDLTGGIDTGPGGVNFSLTDPNPSQDDGRLRFGSGPDKFGLSSIQTSGELDAVLKVTASIGFTVPFSSTFIGFRHTWGLASTVILNLTPPPPGPPPVPQIAGSLSHLGGLDPFLPIPDAAGQLTLFVGEDAPGRRLYDYYDNPIPAEEVDDGTTTENYTITHVSGNAATGETLDVSAFGITQTISGVKSIVAEADAEDLNVDVHQGVTVPVFLYGGDGAADLSYAGSGNAELKAGQKASTLIGGSGSNTLIGGPGGDEIIAGSGFNLIEGGSGNNNIVIQAPNSQASLISGGIGDNNTLTVLEPTGNENIAVTPAGGSFLQVTVHGIRLAKYQLLLDIYVNNVINLVLGAGGGSTLATVGDLSKTPLQNLYLDVGHAPSFSDQSTLTVNGSPGADKFNVSAAANLVAGHPVSTDVTVTSPAGNQMEIHVADFFAPDNLVLAGDGGGDSYFVALDPNLLERITIQDAAPSVNDSLDVFGSNLSAGSLAVTDTAVTVDYTAFYGTFSQPGTAQVHFGPNIRSLEVQAPDAGDEVITADRSAGSTLIYEDDDGRNTFDIRGASAFTLDAEFAVNAFVVHLPSSGGKTTINGNNTSGTLVVDDSANGAGISTDYTVTPGSVTRVDKDKFLFGITLALTSSVTFTTMSQLTLDTNAGAGIPDHTHIEATAAGTTTTINEGTGLNNVYVSQAQQNLDLIAGPLTIAGRGDNRVLLYDKAPNPKSLFPHRNLISVTPTTLTRSSVPVIPFSGSITYTETIHYSGVSEIDLLTPATALTVDTVDPSEGNVNSLTGELEHGFGYNSGGYLVTGSLLPAVQFGNNLTSLNVNESGYGVNFDVYDTPTAFPTTLQTGNDGNLVVHGTSGSLTINGGGGPGPNNVYLGGPRATLQNPSPQGSLAAFQGAVTISGQSGLVVLDINSSADTGLHHAVLTAGSLSGAAPTLISFGGIVALTIHSDRGQGSDFTVAATPAVITTVVDGGPGAHTFYVQSTQGPLDINTGTGDNNVQVGTSGISLRNVGALTVTGGVGGKTTLELNDQANVEGGVFYYAPFVGPASLLTFPTYVITDQSVMRNDSQQYISPLTGQAAFATVVGTVSYNNVASLSLSGGQTPNIFDVQRTATGTPVTINAGGITDVFNIGDATNSLAGIKGALTIGGDSRGMVNVNDQGASAVGNYGVTSNTITRTGAATITYNFMAGMVLNTAAGSNTIDVQSTFTGLFVKTLVTVNTGTGTNTVNVGTLKYLDLIDILTVTGGAGGATTLNLDDQANADTISSSFITTRPAYVFTDDSVIRTDTEVTNLAGRVYPPIYLISTIDFQNLAGLTLNGGTTPNVFNVQGTAAGTPVTINAGKSTDIVNVGDPNNTIDGLLGPLTVYGQKNTVLNVNDQGSTTDETYSLTSMTPAMETLTRTAYPPPDAGGEMINYSGIASLVVHGGSGNNLFGVTATTPDTAVTLYGGTANSDQFMVGDNSDLDSIHGSLTLHGQTAYSFAVFSDLVNAAALTYSLAGNTLQRTGMPDIITFDGLDQVALYAGTGQDTVNVVNTLAATPVSIFTNGGNDALNVSPVTKVSPVANNLDNIAGSLAFDALAGTDTLNLDDQANLPVASYSITASSVNRAGMAAVTFTNIANVFIQTKAGKVVG